MVLGLAGLFAFSTVQATFAQSRINDKVSRNNGASFFANERTSRNLQHARSYTRGIQRYSTQAPVIQPQISQAESQMLGQQLQSIQRDLVIVTRMSMPATKVVEQVKKMERNLVKPHRFRRVCMRNAARHRLTGNLCGNVRKDPCFFRLAEDGARQAAKGTWTRRRCSPACSWSRASRT